MTGIYLIAVAVVWFLLSLYIASALAGWVGLGRWRSLFSLLFLFFLLALPVADEVVGGVQFYSICSKDSKIYIDENNITNKRVRFVGGRHVFSDYPTAVEIVVYPSTFEDVENGKILASYRRYHASGGWLIRILGISENNSPLLFGAGCAPKFEDEFKDKYNIKIIN